MEAASQFMDLTTRNKKRRSFIFSLIASAIIFIIILGITPIKVSITSEDKIKDDNYYVISFIPEGSTDSGNWICYDQNGIRYMNVEFQGKFPQNILSADIYLSGTTFVIYGELIKKSDSYILQSEDWDILYDINRNCDSLRIDFKRIITIYDTKYFDFLF